ncbi:hypothetical protein WHR41_08668 [Cladosporium halotolerans]|uniref:Zn(2)-C6 fungal-type domain-containing protein n=1 Tax=Cladosporium halotolerans TaxID=1052096 RepID=A0AB34KFA3_9PEZI
MSASSLPLANRSAGQMGAPHRSQRSPERPRGKSKRTLIESACTACQKRKSRCDGQRPSCSRCKALHTDCEYNAEAGESRWSALRRKSNMLERERDEARELVAALHSRTESEAQDIYNRVRSSTFSDDMGALIQEVRDATSPRPRLQQQLRPHQQHQDASLHQLDWQQQHAQQSQ